MTASITAKRDRTAAWFECADRFWDAADAYADYRSALDAGTDEVDVDTTLRDVDAAGAMVARFSSHDRAVVREKDAMITRLMGLAAAFDEHQLEQLAEMVAASMGDQLYAGFPSSNPPSQASAVPAVWAPAIQFWSLAADAGLTPGSRAGDFASSSRFGSIVLDLVSAVPNNAMEWADKARVLAFVGALHLTVVGLSTQHTEEQYRLRSNLASFRQRVITASPRALLEGAYGEQSDEDLIRALEAAGVPHLLGDEDVVRVAMLAVHEWLADQGHHHLWPSHRPTSMEIGLLE